MPKKRLKPFAIKGDNTASRLAARAEDLLKANRNIEGETFDRLRDLENEASHHQARSREAALFQLGVLANMGERLAEDLPAYEVDRLLAMNVRLVRSLVSYVEAVTGVDRSECRMDFYFGPAS